MSSELIAKIEDSGYKAAIFSVGRLESVKQSLLQFYAEPYVHQKQKPYSCIRAIDEIPAKYTSVMMIAVPRADRPKSYLADVAVPHIRSIIKEAGYAAKAHQSLPLKRLAVQSGLADYGRNNIACVDGMGSWIRLAAFLTTIPCEADDWREQPTMAAACQNCDICIVNCPAKAISRDRFLLHREKCKGGGGCTVCQQCCPMNEALIP